MSFFSQNLKLLAHRFNATHIPLSGRLSGIIYIDKLLKGNSHICFLCVSIQPRYHADALILFANKKNRGIQIIQRQIFRNCVYSSPTSTRFYNLLDAFPRSTGFGPLFCDGQVAKRTSDAVTFPFVSVYTCVEDGELGRIWNLTTVRPMVFSLV